MAIATGQSAPLAAGPEWRRWLSRNFPHAMAWFILAVVTWGFSYTVGKRLLHPAVAPPLIVYVHGTLFYAWCLLLLVQTALVQQRQVARHRTLGQAFAVAEMGRSYGTPTGFFSVPPTVYRNLGQGRFAQGHSTRLVAGGYDH